MKTITYQREGGVIPSPFSYDCPVWELGNTDDTLAAVEPEEFMFLDQIILVGTLKPYWVEQSVTGQFRDNSGDQFAPVSLYDGMQALRRIEWHGEWLENDKGACEPLKTPFIWGTDFGVQDNNIVADYLLSLDGGDGVWQKTGMSLEPVWSWGGVYQPGCALDDIKHVYFTLYPDGSRTKIQWVTSINPMRQMHCGVIGDFERGAVMAPSMTLMNHIQFGSIRYFLPDVDDLVGYQSARVLDYDVSNAKLKLLFLRRNHGAYSANH